MSRTRDNLVRYAEGGVLSADALQAALCLAGETPDAGGWRRFLDRLLAISGSLLIAVGVIFFVAFNWHALGRYAKFGMLEALILLPTAFALVTGLQSLRARAALLFATLVIGGLLALVGQTYQTGADNYELFLAWALLALPWVLAGRWPPLWAVWWTLLNVALALYLFQVLDPLRMLFLSHIRPAAIIVLNLVGLLAFEWAYVGVADMRTRWLARYCALLALVSGTVAAMMFVFENRNQDNGSGFAIYCAMVIAGTWFYQTRRRDLFPLAFGVLSLIVVTTTWLVRFLFKGHDAFGGLTLLAVLVIGSSIAATWWLRELNRKWDAEPEGNASLPTGQAA